MRKIIFTISLIMTFLSCKKKENNVIEIETKIDSTLIIKTEIKKNEIKTPIDVNLVLGKFDYKSDTTFVKIEANHSSKPIYLNKEVYNAFINMYTSAKKDSVDLIVISGTRNFYEQKSIWERKWEKYKDLGEIERTKKILEYSSMPSTSRHHWGTDLDLNNLNNSYFENGKGKKEYEWLVENANEFGFYQVYTTKENGRTGYNLEKWHWSYLPLANQYLDFYNECIGYENINDFKGSDFAEKAKVISEYVNGISRNTKEFK